MDRLTGNKGTRHERGARDRRPLRGWLEGRLGTQTLPHTARKGNYRLVSLMQKCLTKYQQIKSKNTRRIISQNQRGFTPDTQGCCNIQKSITVIITSTGWKRKAPCPCQHRPPVHDPDFQQTRNREEFPHLTKSIYKKPTVHITLNIKHFALKIRIRKRYFSTLYQKFQPTW